MKTCRTCGQPEEPHNFRHPFVAEGSDLSDGLGPSKRHKEEGQQRGISLPLDPVLRVALIDKGILTPEDLEAAQRKVQVTSDGASISTGVKR